MDRRLLLAALVVVQLAPGAWAADPVPGDVDLALGAAPASPRQGESYVRPLVLTNFKDEPADVWIRGNDSTGRLDVRIDVAPLVTLPMRGDRMVNVTAWIPFDAPVGVYAARIDVTTQMGAPLASIQWTIDVQPAETRPTPPMPPPDYLSVAGPRSLTAGESVVWTVSVTNGVEGGADLALYLAEATGALHLSVRSTVLKSMAFRETRGIEVVVTAPETSGGNYPIEIVLSRVGEVAEHERQVVELSVFQRPFGEHGPVVANETTPELTYAFRVDNVVTDLRAVRGTASLGFTAWNMGSSNATLLVEFDGNAPIPGLRLPLAPGEVVSSTLPLDVSRYYPGTHQLTASFHLAESAGADTRGLTLVVPRPPIEPVLADPVEPAVLLPDGEVRFAVRFSYAGPGAADVTLLGGRSRSADAPEGVELAWDEPVFRLRQGESRVATATLAAPSGYLPAAHEFGYDVRTTVGSSSREDRWTLPLLPAAPPPASEPSGLEVMASAVRAHPVASAGIALGGLSVLALPFARRDWLRYLLALPFVGLYTRLAKTEVLDHKTRERIHQLIVEEPGIHYSAIKDAMKLNAGALVHHLRTLERHQLVASRREGVLRRYYPTGARLPAAPAVPLTPMQQRILDMLDREPRSQKALAAELGLSQQGISYHVKTLERKGVLVVDREGGEWKCFRVHETQVEPVAAT